MEEKTRLLELFKKAADSADMFKDDKREVMGSPMLSEKGKKHEMEENLRLFAEAMKGYREQMLAIVDDREENYTAYQVRATQSKISASNYLLVLRENLDMLKSGYMGEIEVTALLKLYKEDDWAYGRIEEVMRQTHSHYIDLLEDRITVRKQLNAFGSIRRIIRSNITGYLAEKPVYKPPVSSQSGIKQTPFSREACYFGSGYTAILEELNEDLTINRPDATLAVKNNSDANMRIHHESNMDVMKAENSAGRQQEKKVTKEERLTDPAALPGMKRD